MSERPNSALRSFLLVAVQFACLGVLLFSGPLLPASAALRALLGAALLLGLWALASMDRRSFTAWPDVRPGGRLTTRGPYRYIRHPMYAAVLLAALALVLDHPSVVRTAAGLVLLADLLAKLSYEERLLEQRFAEYRDYRDRTKRLIPFLY